VVLSRVLLIMFGTMSTIASEIFGNGSRNILIRTILAASLVSGDTVVNLLLEDSSIGESDIRLVGKVVGSIIGVVRYQFPAASVTDKKQGLTATTYGVACATTGPIVFPFTTPACVGGDHVTITQGASTMFLTQVFVTAKTSQ
jgi:hypothetical protein